MVTAVFEQADRIELEAALQEQAELRQESQRMEALGRIACAVAHDFNNVLSAVSLGIDTLAAGSQQEATAEVSEMIRFGQRLTRQLLEFGKQQAEPARATTDASSSLRAMFPMLRTAAGARIDVQLAISTDAARIALEQSQFEQVVFNLCLNARDAITGAGEIKITLREPSAHDEAAPESLVVEVSDTGAGMSEGTRARIFEPFFTTKDGGVGLGLATVYGIVRRANGLLRVDSQPGRGTTVLVALPHATGA